MKTFRADLKIDKHNIDNEILEQAQKYYDWAILEVDAAAERDRQKDLLDLTLVEVEDEIRSNPSKFMNHSPTESAIKAAIGNDSRVKRAKRHWRIAKKEHSIILKAEKAFEMRKKMIENYIYHFHRMMNSDVKVPKKYEEKFSKDTRNILEKELEAEME